MRISQKTGMAGIRKSYSLLLAVLFSMILGCGGTDDKSSSGMGSVSFKVTSEDSVLVKNNTDKNLTDILNKNLPFFSMRTAMADGFSENCNTDYFSIKAFILDAVGKRIIEEGPWPCSARKGRISDVPAGTDFTIRIQANDINGKTLYYGEKNGIQIIAEENTDAGYIRLRPLTDSGYIEMSDGTNIYYEMEGEGEPLILIHGGEQTIRSWDAQVAEFAQKYQVIRYDIRYFGSSDAQGDHPIFTWGWSEGEHRATTDLLEIMEYMNLTRANICGLSLGSAIASQFEVFHPDMVDKLILASPWSNQTFPTDGQQMAELENKKNDTLIIVGRNDQYGSLAYVKGKNLEGYDPDTAFIDNADHNCNNSQPEVFNRTVLQWFEDGSVYIPDDTSVTLNAVTGGISQEDRPGMIAIYLWGDVHAGSHGANDFQLTTPLGGGLINNYTIYYEEFTTDRPIIIEGKTISEYHKWTIDYQPEQHASGTINFGYTLEGISGTSQLVVNPVNDPPEVEEDIFYIKEDAVNGTFATVNPQSGQAGQVNAYEEQGSGENDIPFIYSIIGGDGQGRFEVDNAGRIKLRQGPLDYETQTEYNLLVEVRDSGGDLHQGEDWNSNWITIKIEDVPEGLVIGNIPVQHTNEDIPFSGTLSPYVSDPDTPIQDLTFQLVSNASIGNVVLNSNGTFIYTPNPSYNHDDLNGSYDIFTFRVTDGTESAIGTVRVDVTPVNDEPSFNINDADKILHVNENGEGNQNGRTYQINAWTNNFDEGPSIKPPYNEENQSYIDFQVTTTVNEVSGNTTLFEQMPDIVIANTAENSETGTLKFKLAENAYGKATVRVTLQDNGGTANGGVDTSQPYTFSITIGSGFGFFPPMSDLHPNIDPSVGVGDLCYGENDPEKIMADQFILTDEDSGVMAGAMMQITNNYINGEDVLSFENTANIIDAWDAASGTLTLTGQATTAEYQTAIRTIKYLNQGGENPTESVRTVTLTITDTDGMEGTDTMTATIDAVNDAPTIETGQTSNLEYTDGDGRVVVDDTLVLADVDDTHMTSATIAIDSYVAGDETLHFEDTATIKGVFENGVLTIIGNATKVEYQAAIRSVQYENTGDLTGGQVTKSITINVYDNNSNGIGSRDCSFIDPSDPNYDPDQDPGGTQPGTIVRALNLG